MSLNTLIPQKDYRDRLNEIIARTNETKKLSQRAIGRHLQMSNAQWSYVVKKERGLSITSLVEILELMGYTMVFVPLINASEQLIVTEEVKVEAAAEGGEV